MINPETRKRLADLMERRRLDLRLTWREVAEAGGISYEALRAARNGTGDIRPLTQAAVENGLRWERGSVGLALAGGDPLPADAPPRLSPADVDAALQRGPGDYPAYDAAAQSLVEPHFEAVQALIKAAILKGADLPVPKGAQVFRDAWEQQRWDRLVAAGRDFEPPGGFSLWELAMAMATGRARDDAAQSQGRAAGLTLMRG